jgi:chromosome segregation ATPase
MRLKSLELTSFKSFAKKTALEFQSPITCVVGPNGSGKSNVVEAIRFVLGEQSMKSMRGKGGIDLIFKGSKNLAKSSRAAVSIYIDNKDKIFRLENEGGEKINLNYDTVTISREVFADGLNKYSLNGTEVRLKDIMALLASVNIGSSGHQIISQGEADRILNASLKERREMIEDALGLKIYQYKIKESERKLERTEGNMKEVSLLRREIAPHLKFLKGQVEKFAKAKEMKDELLSLYLEYLKYESVYLEREKSNLSTEKNKISKELASIGGKIGDEKSEDSAEENKNKEELKNLERKITEIRNLKSEVERKLGRIEGMLEMQGKSPNEPHKSGSISVPEDELHNFLTEAHEYLEEAMYMDVLENIAPILRKIKDILDRFARTAGSASSKPNAPKDFSALENTKKEIMAEMEKLGDEEKKIAHEIEILKNEIASKLEAGRDKERAKFELKVRNQELTSSLSLIAVKEENLTREAEAFENEVREGTALVGYEITDYKKFKGGENPDRHSQEEKRKKIERIKIKLEDIGAGGGEELMKEFNEISERDAFLAKEMEDLGKSIESLRTLMLDLKEKIDIEFRDGVKKINKEFQEFFALMFGGGSALLSVVAEQKRKKGEEDEIEEDELKEENGIEISVSLPHKKVKELHALSGGERSLTSIALLFAMSQVNPPPFLVLDETDAALDEANSRKYGDMLEKLSKHSELIVVTHNRETMSRAGALYGVTIGPDGASKLLSVKFEEATVIAK